MLQRINGRQDDSGARVQIRDASFPAPFVSGLEYSPPARGTWNIVHTGMLLPGSHQIHVCSQGCLRGVVLTAAEMGAQHRFSTIAIREDDVLSGDMEGLIIDGVTDILQKLPRLPTVVLVFTSCIHHFMGCDLELVYDTLRARFPGVGFTDCYMNPIMRKSGLTPDQLMRIRLYRFLELREKNPKCVNLIGNDLPTDDTCELYRLAEEAGVTLRDITRCKTFADYLALSESFLNLTGQPAAMAAGEDLEERLGQQHLYLPLCFGYEEIAACLNRFAQAVGLPPRSWSEEAAKADQALESARSVLGDTPIAIDYTATHRPLGLARLLLEHGFSVVRVYADSFSGEEEADFRWLALHVPTLDLYPTVQFKMRVLDRTTDRPMVAIGQKAAYFTGSSHFVNIVSGGGMYGFDGIVRLTALLTDAYLHGKDTRALIQIKGWGCHCG